MTDFARRLRFYRATTGISQAQIAAILEVHPTAVTHWESGRSEPNAATKRVLADEFGLPPDWFSAPWIQVEELEEKRFQRLNKAIPQLNAASLKGFMIDYVAMDAIRRERLAEEGEKPAAIGKIIYGGVSWTADWPDDKPAESDSAAVP